MDYLMNPYDAEHFHTPNELGQLLSHGEMSTCLDGEILALRCHNIQLQDQVQNLTLSLQQASSHQRSQLFYLFPRLPPELRRKIWRHALPSPRIMSVDFLARSRSPAPTFATNQPSPTLLRVCHESREVALENYELAFRSEGPEGTGSPKGNATGAAPGGFYFDFRGDTLCFTRETMPLRIVLFLEDMAPAQVRRVRRLAVGTELPKDVVKYITQFHGLEVFSLILSDPRVVTPVGRFALVEADHRSIWVMGAYWNHELTSWGRMEAKLREAFEDERMLEPEYKVPRVEFVYAVSADEGCCRDCPGHEQEA